MGRVRANIPGSSPDAKTPTRATPSQDPKAPA